MTAASLLLPAIRWDPVRGYDGERHAINAALAAGVGGFILFGGEQDAVRQLTKELRQRSRTPLLIGADLERGAGQQFGGATGLPPLSAIASLGDPDLVRRAARLTAREARTLGVNWDYAPVCDLDLMPDNPIVGTRSLGSDPRKVSQLAADWIQACQSEGVLACAKHFPGHGRTTADSHLELPVVSATRGELLDIDIAPFAAAVQAGVASIMTAHVAYPALDASGAPATTSREMLQWLLRQQLRFDGLIVTDALVMEGARAGRSEADAAVAAVTAGCDLLLYPSDVEATARALDDAVASRRLDSSRVQQSERRRLKWAQWASPPNEYRRPSGTDIAWGAQLADRVVRVVRGEPRPPRSPFDLLMIDDDADADAAPSRDELIATLRHCGRDVRVVTEPTAATSTRELVIALFGDVRAGKGRPDYSAATRSALDDAVAASPDALVVQFGHPRLANDLASARRVVSVWGGDAVMQQAAARWLAARA